MPKRVRQSSFVGGEISPELYSRSDIERFQSSVRRLRNFIPTAEGTAKNRPGFQFIREVKSSSSRVRLVPFLFGNAQNYILEFGHNSLRIIQNAGHVIASPTVYSGATTYLVDQYVSYNGRVYRSLQANNLNHTPPNGTWWVDVGAAGTSIPYELTTPWTESQLFRLKFAQSGDTVMVCVVNTQPYTIQRYGQADWRITAWDVTRAAAAPTALNLTGVGATDTYHVSKDWGWVVTTITSGDIPEESLPSASVRQTCAVYPDRPLNVNWTAAAGAASYNIYRGQGGSSFYGYVGNTSNTTFRDDGQIPVYAEAPPAGKNPFFGGGGKWPQVPAYFGQRLWFANSYNAPQAIWSSKIGSLKNFDASQPPKSDDAIFVNIASKTFDEIRGILPWNQLILFCSNSEWILTGADGNLPSPLSLDARPRSYWGSSWLDPIMAGDQPLFVTDKDFHVRELDYDRSGDKSSGRDLTVVASHLIRNRTIVDWAYARTPFTTIWMVRDDGVLLSLGYSKQGDHIAWAWHDMTGGYFESVAVCPEGSEDVVYAVVRRTVGGSTKRYIERLMSRTVTDARYGYFLDSCAWVDNANTSSTTLTMNGASWQIGASVTVAASASTFTAGDVGKYLSLMPGESDGDVWLVITSYSNATTVTAQVMTEVPVALRGVATADWAKMTKTVSGLSHLEGLTVYACADGKKQGPFTVSGGTITLDTPAAFVVTGVSYISDLELNDLYDSAKGAITEDSMALTSRFVRRVGFDLVDSGPVLAGESDERLLRYNSVDAPDYTTRLLTGQVIVNIESAWNLHGRAILRQQDPFPVCVIGATREVEYGEQMQFGGNQR